MSKLKWFSSRLGVVCAQSTEAKCSVDNEDVVGAAPTGDAPTTSELLTIVLPTKLRLILETWRYFENDFTTGTWIMVKHNYAEFECQMRFGNISCTSTWFCIQRMDIARFDYFPSNVVAGCMDNSTNWVGLLWKLYFMVKITQTEMHRI